MTQILTGMFCITVANILLVYIFNFDMFDMFSFAVDTFKLETQIMRSIFNSTDVEVPWFLLSFYNIRKYIIDLSWFLLSFYNIRKYLINLSWFQLSFYNIRKYIIDYLGFYCLFIIYGSI